MCPWHKAFAFMALRANSWICSPQFPPLPVQKRDAQHRFLQHKGPLGGTHGKLCSTVSEYRFPFGMCFFVEILLAVLVLFCLWFLNFLSTKRNNGTTLRQPPLKFSSVFTTTPTCTRAKSFKELCSSLILLVAFQSQTQNRSVFVTQFPKSQPMPPVVALNRKSKSQIAARYAAFWHAAPQIALAYFL